VQLSIGVDNRTNTLVVSASDSLYRQIEALVNSLDESAGQARRTVRVVSLQNANSLVVQQTLASLMGKVRTAGGAPNGGRPAAANGATTSSSGASQNSDQQQQQTQPQVDPAAQFMQQQMMRRMMFQGGPGGGFGRGGGRGGNNNGN
jgi:type II secretory pathway component GspD/PulD (secretin)